MVQRKALLIGINYNGTRAELNGCVNDVKNMYKFLTENWGFKQDEIVVLTDEPENKNGHYYPTKSHILRQLKNLVKDCQSDSRLFLHYSGHGSQVKDKSGDESDGKDETWVPVDYNRAGMILDDDIRRIVGDNVVPGAQLVCISDCCHSGTAMDLRYKMLCSTNEFMNNYSLHESKQYPETPGQVICLSGCMDTQTSADYYATNREYCGALSRAFLDTMEHYNNKQKNMSYLKMVKRVRKLLSKREFTQLPQFTFGRSFNPHEEFKLW